MRSHLISILILAALALPVCGQLPVPVATVALSSSVNPAVYGAPVTFTVTVTGTGAPGNVLPTGNVTLIDSAYSQVPLATLPLDATGTVKLSFPLLTAVGGTGSTPPNPIPIPYVLSGGTHNISAVYSGDNIYPYTFTSVLPQQIQKAGTAMAVTSSTTTYGAINLTASVVVTGGSVPCPSITGSQQQDGSPTGSVQFFNGGQSLGSVNLAQGTVAGCVSVATLSVAQVNGTLTATYSGDGNFNVSTFTSTQTNPQNPSGMQLPTTLTLSATPANPTIVQPVTLTATIGIGDGAMVPTGVVQFFADGARLLGTANVTADSRAFITVPGLGGGPHNVNANYSGDVNYSPSTDNIGEYIAKLPVSLSLSASTASAAYGQPVTLTAQPQAGIQTVGVIPAPTGTVQFSTGCYCGLFNGFVTQSVIGSATVNKGVANLVTTNLPGGALVIVATYSGDDNWVSVGSNTLPLAISKAPTTTTLTALGTDPKSGGRTATAIVQSTTPGVPTGTIQVLDAASGVLLGTATLSAAGAATVAVATTRTGDFSAGPVPAAIVAAYSGDTNFVPSQSIPASFLTIADAAGYGTSSMAPDEIVSIFGGNLASQTSSGAPVQIVDSTGVSRTPALLLVSASQINLVISSDTALGTATMTVSSSTGPTFSQPFTVTSVAPGLFAANGGGTGPAAAQIIRVHPDGSQAVQAVAALDASGKNWIATPISFGSDSLYLVLYGTGIRHRSDNAQVTCAIGSSVLPVLYSGAQGAFAGLDQVNVALPATLQGAGAVNVTLTADGKSSNTVTLAFQ